MTPEEKEKFTKDFFDSMPQVLGELREKIRNSKADAWDALTSDKDAALKALESVWGPQYIDGEQQWYDPDFHIVVGKLVAYWKNQFIEQQGRVRQLEDAIRNHRNQHGDDKCFLDDQELYKVLGDGNLGDATVGDKAAMLENCKRFINNRCESGGPWVSYAELEKENISFKKAILNLWQHQSVVELDSGIIDYVDNNWSDASDWDLYRYFLLKVILLARDEL